MILCGLDLVLCFDAGIAFRPKVVLTSSGSPLSSNRPVAPPGGDEGRLRLERIDSLTREVQPICLQRPLPHWARREPFEALRHWLSPLWRPVPLHWSQAAASSRRLAVPFTGGRVEGRGAAVAGRAAGRPAGDGSPFHRARRRRGRPRRHHRGPTAGMTDKKGDPCRCPTLELTSQWDEGIEESYRRSTSAATAILPVAAQFSQTLPPFRRRRRARCERQLPRPTRSAKIPGNRAVARDFFAADDRCRLLHGVTQGCPGPWTAATIPSTCRSRAAIGS